MQKKSWRWPVLTLALLGAAGCNLAPRTGDWVGEGVFPQGIEGPAVGPDGTLYVVNFARPGTIGVVAGQGQARLWLTLPAGSVASGLRFGRGGFLYAADHRGHNILRIDPATRDVAVWLHEPRMHQPNDLTLADDGGLYASDPDWSAGTGRIWYANAAGRARIVADNLGTANGIALSPDGRLLYVAETVQRRVRVFDVRADGSLDAGRVLITFARHGPDGLRVDVRGNLYLARYGAGKVTVVSPTGTLIRSVALTGRYPTNLTFGGEDGRRVFVTVDKRGAVEWFRAPYPGADWARLKR